MSLEGMTLSPEPATATHCLQALLGVTTEIAPLEDSDERHDGFGGEVGVRQW